MVRNHVEKYKIASIEKIFIHLEETIPKSTIATPPQSDSEKSEYL